MTKNKSDGQQRPQSRTDAAPLNHLSAAASAKEGGMRMPDGPVTPNAQPNFSAGIHSEPKHPWGTRKYITTLSQEIYLNPFQHTMLARFSGVSQLEDTANVSRIIQII